jgi:hypothetical protein
MSTCGILFGNEPGYAPKDEHGCTRPSGHPGPHEFVATNGRTYEWETDLMCDCEHCMRCEGDYCTTYSEKKTS